MEPLFEYAILSGPLLLLIALLQRKWSRRRAVLLVAVVIGSLTALHGSIDWGGGVDANITRGVVTIYGMVVSGAAFLTSMLMFMINPPKPADDADEVRGS